MQTFKNKKDLTTEQTGLKGSWLVLWLNLLNAKVVGISNKIMTKLSHYEVINLKNKTFNSSEGSQMRDFLYVDDLVNLIKKILRSKKIKLFGI